MELNIVNELMEEYYKLFFETEDIALKQGIRCLTTTELHVIEAIGEESLSMNELSEKLGITMGTATVAINKLSEKGFIDRKRCEKDRRKVYVMLSKKGQEAYNYHRNFHKNLINNITKNLTDDEIESFKKVFEKILDNLKNKLESIKPVNILHFKEGDTLRILSIKGSPAIKNFFCERGLLIDKDALVLEKNMINIRLKTESGEMDINHIDAKNIIAVKKEFDF